ncbi:MAG TPA: collagen-binding domain-containing protein [Chthoniobacterales bacterium]|nr:collagen-binding domain-containing protein [Chthoniobacterales bacterium]
MHYKRLFMSLSIAAVAVGIFTAGAATDTLPGGAINVGSADYFTVLAKGDAGFTDNTITGPSFVTGNYGLGGGKLSITGSSKITGKLVKATGTQLNTSGQGTVTGGVSTDDAQLDSAFADAAALSDAAAMEAVTPAYASLTSVNGSMTITGAPGQKVVLSLQDFKLNGGATFTLQGTATTSFIVNVSKTFALTGGSKIVLSGVPPENVLFNIRGTGSQVSFSGGSSMSGILLAMNRKVDLSAGHVLGKVIANQVVITSGGSVITPSTNK